MNRLHLDFSLNTNTERSAFVRTYLAQEPFLSYPPTESELGTIADYILYGRDPETGKNFVQSKDGSIATKHGTWDADHETESLDALIEQPTFNEASLANPSTSPHYTTPNSKFSRREALANAPDHLVPLFRDLFARIDLLDLRLNIYDDQHGRRTKPIRESLLTKFTPEQITAAADLVSDWSYYYYLKQRHELVELRREQYTLRDSFATPILRHTDDLPAPAVSIDWEAEIDVLPLGLRNQHTSLIFRDQWQMTPDYYQDDEVQQVIHYYWQKRNSSSSLRFDFRDVECVYQLFLVFYEIEDSAAAAPMDNSGALIDTLKYYIEMADLTDLQKDVLDAKIRHIRNADIAYDINRKYNKNYTDNYISTIFRQKIIPQINSAAHEHEKIIGNLSFPEEFKTCSCCGRTWLRDADHFVRKARAKDGLSSKCKKCDRQDRKEKKVIQLVQK